ncbi:MAG: holo-ACP synthase [Lachnospiraceae bacterium]|nr:holo-ACP synthase [Lachnospiraceae bacterium]
MIVGIGNDITEIARITEACQKQAFVRRVYTEKEQELAKNSPACLAGNFAVKEAVAKALGTGFRGFGPGDVEVLRDDLGKPYVVLYSGARKRAEELGVTQVHVSITDTKEMAAAVAVAEGR